MNENIPSSVSTVALIGSFRQHYNIVLEPLTVFKGIGLLVSTPIGTRIIKNGIPFVRFESDESEWTDEMIQVVALHRILRADFVFVVVPNGYVGRTTCYEIGRIIQARKPVYFSERPNDLPVCIPADHICSASYLAEQILAGRFRPRPLHTNRANLVEKLEQDLLNGHYKTI